MDMDKLQELIRVFEASDLAELEIEEEGRRVCLKKATATNLVPIPARAVTAAPVGESVAPVAPPPEVRPMVASPEPKAEPVELATINSPMVGVFYAAPAPSEPPFVRPGDTVDENQTVCIVEAMKLMNEVSAKFPAVIERVLVENGEPVEFGQPLFAVRPVEQI
ncbi:MAG: acetyl-CoA carboxylase biotin carboxyl carrier protein [Candidatus Hydrogenedentes bacterium]|nr:acetyl-CoA carboxylase biotin carboxyl carrier protein [Candidatus Hydrogenedentota bacterium]